MAAPTVYTEKTLADFMHALLGPAAGILGYAVGTADAGSYQEAVNSTLLAYGAQSIAQAVDIESLRALARVEVFRMAVGGLAALYDFSAENGSYQRSQMLAGARANLQAAELAALPYDPAYRVRVTRQAPVNDPYRYVADDERTL